MRCFGFTYPQLIFLWIWGRETGREGQNNCYSIKRSTFTGDKSVMASETNFRAFQVTNVAPLSVTMFLHFKPGLILNVLLHSVPFWGSPFRQLIKKR
jgi:hypothetical protein